MFPISESLRELRGLWTAHAVKKLGISWKFAFFKSSSRMEKNHPMVPPLDHFQGKNKIYSSLARTISASRWSFFANLSTFERRSGLKKVFLPKIVIVRKEHFFSPERRSKVAKFAKNDRLDVLIVVARDEQFLFFPWKLSKGGTIGWFFSILGLDSEKINFQKTKVKSNPSLTWAWPSSAPACLFFFSILERS